MLKTRYIKILVSELGTEQYFLSAMDEGDRYFYPSVWQHLLLNGHKESFYGTMVDHKTVAGIEGIVLNGWQLATLFSGEQFNRMVDWDWDETAGLCLAAAHTVYDAISEKEWMPDFASWEQDEFRWALPDRVVNEFLPAFWEQNGVRSFMEKWFNLALEGYMKQNRELKYSFGKKLQALRDGTIAPSQLAEYFDEDSFREWIGIKESAVPFTLGVKLEEPADAADFWTLECFLRDKKNQDLVVDLGNSGEYPRTWLPHLETVQAEQERWMRLFPWLNGGKHEPRLTDKLSENEAWLFLTDVSETLLALGVDILLPSWWQAMKSASLKVKAKVKSASTSYRPSFVGLQAMLDYDWRFSMNGVELSEEEFNQLVDEKRRLVFVRGRWIKLDPEFIHQIQELMKKAEKEGLQVRDVIEQELFAEEGVGSIADELENPKAFAKIQIELNRQWKSMIKGLRNLQELPLEPVPQSFRGELRPYQQLGMSWLLYLRKFGFGGCLADDMGLGKTVQLISYMLKVKEENGGAVAKVTGNSGKAATAGIAANPSETNVGPRIAANPGETNADAEIAGYPGETAATAEIAGNSSETTAAEQTEAALIICPTSVLGNWQKELERFAPDLSIYLHYGPARPHGEEFAAKVLEADVVLTSYGLTHLDLDDFLQLTWSTIAIDEAQNIKNADTKQSRAVRKLKGQHHIALTGTPMENRLSELWSIFDFINHGYLGSSGQFQKRFVLPIERDDEKERIRQLQALIRPFLLRRTKKDEDVALNLPDKLEQKEYCPLTAEQASLYEQLVHDSLADIDKLSPFERKGLILQMLSRLKQLCNHPALYLKEQRPVNLIERSAKLEKLQELVGAVLEQEESCLIFTQYIEMGHMIQTMIEEEFGVEVPFLNGSVAKSQRDRMIDEFQNREFPIFLLSLKAGGTGLNLTAANHVIHYDRWWNPAVENQATDRAYRIGQKRFVHVHKMICTGTLEEKIDLMLDKKQSLNDEIIQSDSWITELSTDDLRELIHLGK
ncbi:DEAD/DEAH box helicase [Bacillus benzoevorans]|uniref:SNF2 family DNA or RNA helicase n=1 Tax=Bacillus benzoevorans TaxID=1456 RepID=A0A7X0HUT4_9BACI|nr:DEAD/DEAH box helicase [Bacillus benzoevorans]MBB6447233.1 SNF2 family DNA or RNA helicase [Bacillus benzoevorans]